MHHGTLVSCATWSVTAPATPNDAASISPTATPRALQETLERSPRSPSWSSVTNSSMATGVGRVRRGSNSPSSVLVPPTSPASSMRSLYCGRGPWSGFDLVEHLERSDASRASRFDRTRPGSDLTFPCRSITSQAMTTSPSAASGPYTARDIRSLYPSISENHLRYLEKWGLVRADSPRDRAAVLVRRSADGQAGRRRSSRRARRCASSCARCSPSVRDSSRSTSTRPRRDRHAARQGAVAAGAAGAGDASPRRVDQPGRVGVVRRLARGLRRLRSAARARRQVLRGRVAPGRRRWAEDGGGGGGVPQGAGGRSRSGAGDRQPREHPLRARRGDRGAGALRARHRPRSGMLRGALQPRQHSPRPRPLQACARLLSRRRRAERRLRRRALLPGGDAREDRTVAGGQAALAGVSAARAERRVGGAGEGVF